MSDPLVIESAIAELTGQFKRQLKAGGGPHGKDWRIMLEGHDISHLVRAFDLQASPHDAIVAHLELIGIEFVNE